MKTKDSGKYRPHAFKHARGGGDRKGTGDMYPQSGNTPPEEDPY